MLAEISRLIGTFKLFIGKTRVTDVQSQVGPMVRRKLMVR